MAINEDVGSVATLWRFPVKSMGGEQLHDVEVTERGVLGDRAYALIDKDTGKVVSAKSVRLFPNLLDCKAVFVEPPRRGGDLPAVQILSPNGMTIRSDAGEADRVLSVYFKRNVTLGRVAPDDFTIDQCPPPTSQRFLALTSERRSAPLRRQRRTPHRGMVRGG